MSAVVRFDPIDVARRAIVREHQSAEAATRTATAHARRCGLLLLELKERFAYGRWGEFLATLPFSDSTAHGYMKLARLGGEEYQRVGNLALREALRMLVDRREREYSPDAVTLPLFPADALPLPTPPKPGEPRPVGYVPPAAKPPHEWPDDPADLVPLLSVRYPDWEFRPRVPLQLVRTVST